MNDFYKILGISHSASTIEIRRAYRRRALELHPDVNNSATAKQEFILVNEAYSVLKNSISKIRYDKLYRVHFLKENVRNENRFRKREQSRTQGYSRKSQRGNRRAEEYSKTSGEKFEERQEKSSSWDKIWHIIGAFFELFDAFF